MTEPLELLLEVQTVQVLASQCGNDTDAMGAAMKRADVVRLDLGSSDVAEKALLVAKVNDAVQRVGRIFDAATVSEWKGLENSQEESNLGKLVQTPEVYNLVLEEWDEDKLTSMFFIERGPNDDHWPDVITGHSTPS